MRGGHATGFSPAKRGSATMTLPRPPALTAKPGVRGMGMPSRGGGISRGGMMSRGGAGGVISPAKVMAARGRASSVMQRTMRGAMGGGPVARGGGGAPGTRWVVQV